MFAWLKRFVAPVAAIAFLGAATFAAKADTVSFYTQGHFTSGGAGGSVGSPDYLLNVGALTLKYNNDTIVESFFIPGVVEATTFGYFTTNATNLSTLSSFNGAGFKLDIFQTLPDNDANPNNDGGTFVGSLSGSLFWTGGPDGSLTLNFNAPLDIILPAGQTAYPPAVWYHVDASQSIDISDGGQIRGALSAVPLPGVALAGMALMGCVGGLRKARNRAEEPAVA